MSESRGTGDDRVTAALAHGAAILPFWGLIASVIIWATQKEKSRFVAFHALQALIYQLTPLLIGILFVACYFCLAIVFFLPIFSIPLWVDRLQEDTAGFVAFLTSLFSMGLPFCLIGLMTVVWLAYLGYALYGAFRVFQGYDFRYAVIGQWVERSLEGTPLAAQP